MFFCPCLRNCLRYGCRGAAFSCFCHPVSCYCWWCCWWRRLTFPALATWHLKEVKIFYYGEAVREQRRQGVWQGCCGDWADSGSHSLQSASGAPGRWGPRTLQLLNHIKCPALPYTCPAAATAEHTTQFGRSVHTPMHNLLHSRTAHPAEPTKVVELLPPSHHCCVHL